MQPRDFIQALPKAELHLHIEGALPWGMLQVRVKSLPSPPPWWAPDYRFDNFTHFARVMSQCYESTLISTESYYLAAQGIFDNLLAQNVRYVELSYSLGHARSRGLPQREIVEAIKQAASPNLIVRIFCGVSRSRPELLRQDVLEAVLDLPGPPRTAPTGRYGGPVHLPESRARPLAEDYRSMSIWQVDVNQLLASLDQAEISTT